MKAIVTVWLLLLTFGTFAGIRHVDANNASPSFPYDSWNNAATNIQDAVDAANPGDAVLVTNGIYRFGKRVIAVSTSTNRVGVNKTISIQSVNGPSVTIIDGSGLFRCVGLTNGAFLAGFTLTNGAIGDSGGGVFGTAANAVVSNCVITGNSAYNGGGASGVTLYNCSLIGNTAVYGGGASFGNLNSCVLTSNSVSSGGGGANQCTLNQCIISNNVTSYGGGGALHSTLNNCIVIGNRADTGGGAWGGTLNNCTIISNSASWGGGGSVGGFHRNCILYYNTAASTGDNYFQSKIAGNLKFTCTIPPEGGTGDITNEPSFVDLAGGDLRLSSNSPCINAGNNLYVTNATDFENNTRIVGGPVDLGSCEFQTPGSVLSYAWLQRYGLPTDGSADYSDSDLDTMNNWKEWKCDTDPTDINSALLMLAPSNDVSGIMVSWRSVDTRTYFIESTTNLTAGPAFSLLASNIVGQIDMTSFTDISTNKPKAFYRVGIQ